MCQMSAILEFHPLDLWNFQEREDRSLLDLIERRGDKKSRTSDPMNYPGDIPVPQVAHTSGELRRPRPI